MRTLLLAAVFLVCGCRADTKPSRPPNQFETVKTVEVVKTVVVEKPVYIEKVVEKVVYRDREVPAPKAEVPKKEHVLRNPRVNRENYGMLKRGMTHDQVVKILGEPDSYDDNASDFITMGRWNDGGRPPSRIVVVYYYGKLESKDLLDKRK